MMAKPVRLKAVRLALTTDPCLAEAVLHKEKGKQETGEHQHDLG